MMTYICPWGSYLGSHASMSDTPDKVHVTTLTQMIADVPTVAIKSFPDLNCLEA